MMPNTRRWLHMIETLEVRDPCPGYKLSIQDHFNLIQNATSSQCLTMHQAIVVDSYSPTSWYCFFALDSKGTPEVGRL